MENVIVSSIVFLMVTVLFFSLGVERGKKLVVSGKVLPPQSDSSQAVADNDGIVVIQSDEPNKTQKAATAAVPANGSVVQEQVIDVGAPVELALATTEASDFYTIQVASFKVGSKYADKEATNLKSYGQETFILPKGNYSIVCVGKFKEKNDAQQFSKKLKSKYNDCLVRRL